MTVRRIDPVAGDIVTSGVQFISEREEIAQTIATRLRLFLGEYFRNTNDGTPWFESILGKSGTLTNRDAALKQRINQTEGVQQIIEFNSDYDPVTRVYSVTGQVLTEFGATEFGIGEVI